MSFNRLLKPGEEAKNGRRVAWLWGGFFLLFTGLCFVTTKENLAKAPFIGPITIGIVWMIAAAIAYLYLRQLKLALERIKLSDADLLERLPSKPRILEPMKWGYVAFGDDWIGAVYKPLTTLWVTGEQINAVVRGCDRWTEAKHLRDHETELPTVEQLAGHWVMIVNDKPDAHVMLIPVANREEAIWLYDSVILIANGESVAQMRKKPETIWTRRFGDSERSNMIGSTSTSIFALVLFGLIATSMVVTGKGGGGLATMWMLAMNPFLFMTKRLDPAGDPLARASADFQGPETLLTDRQVFGPAGGYLYLARKDFVFDAVPLSQIEEIELKERSASIWERDLTERSPQTKAKLTLKLRRDHDQDLEFDLPPEQANRIYDAVLAKTGRSSLAG